jgi:hypothetical protein
MPSEVHDIIEWVSISLMIGSASIQAIINTTRSFYQLIQKFKRLKKSSKVMNEDQNIKNINNSDQKSELNNSSNEVNTSFEFSNRAFHSFYNSLHRKDKRLTALEIAS